MSTIQKVFILFSLSLTLVFPALKTSLANEQNFKIYHNGRFNYSISYPAEILLPQGEAENGDGQKFISKDGKVELIVYGSNNALDQTLKDTYQKALSGSADSKDRKVTYKKLGDHWFVVSGIEQGKIFYQKTYLKDDAFKTFEITYDQAQKASFDKITEAISKSFKVE